MNKRKKVIILGAGPAGLALAYELIASKSNFEPIIIEKNNCVGGLSRTVYFDEIGVDIGGHRLLTKDKYIKSIWNRFLPVQNAPSIDDILCNRITNYPQIGLNPNKEDNVMLIRNRFSSILYNSKFFDYPLKINFDTFKKLSLTTTFKAGISYLYSLFFQKNEKNLEDFFINRFGKEIYNIFFKDYTKKVWGVLPSELSNEWGEERIKKLSLLKAIINPIVSKFKFLKKYQEKSLTDIFYYPKFGCSQLWNLMAEYILNNGGKMYLNCEYAGFNLSEDKILSLKYITKGGKIEEIAGDYFASSIPIADLIKGIDAPYDIKQNALNLPYRDYILVNFYTNQFNLKNNTKYNTINNITPECWIYLQEKSVKASRIQIMNNWSPYLAGNYRKNYSISLEYFTNKNDNFWKLSDSDIINLAIEECKNLNLFDCSSILKSNVIREEKAYPSYFGTYKNINKIKEYLSCINNLRLIGRNGQHKYNNMDEAMISGINMARNIMNRKNYD